MKESPDKSDELKQAQKYLDSAFNYLEKARQILFSKRLSELAPDNKTEENRQESEMEGIFNGEGMIAKNNKQYPIPENYASKSKLVAGDLLKLTISEEGDFRFKQIGPVQRAKRLGKLIKSGDCYEAVVGKKHFRILKASVTYFKAKPGDKLSIIIPKNEDSVFAAVENIVGGANGS